MLWRSCLSILTGLLRTVIQLVSVLTALHVCTRLRNLGICHAHLLQYRKLEEELKSEGRTVCYFASCSADILDQNQALALCSSASELIWK